MDPVEKCLRETFFYGSSDCIICYKKMSSFYNILLHREEGNKVTRMKEM